MAEKDSTQASPDSRSKGLSYPAEWSDEERMHFLMAPFPPGSQTPNIGLNNPKVKFWRCFILSTSKEMKRPVFTEEDLMERLKWRGVAPSCLPDVIRVMEREGDVIKLTEFVGDLDVGWAAWMFGVVSKPVAWTLRSYLPAKKCTAEYVITPVLKELAQSVLATHHRAVQYKSTDRVMQYREFRELCLTVVAPESVLIVEQYLRQQQLIAKAGTERGWEVVKFASGEDRSRPVVSNTDIGIVGMKETVRALSEQVKSLEERKQRLKDMARKKVRLRDRRAALNCLRQARMVESILSKREVALHNVQTILGQIQMAETDAMILQSYKSGTEALKAMRESQGLSADSAESVMVELQEAMELNEEVTNILSGEVAEDKEDYDELERELEGLLSPQRGSSSVEDDLSRRLTALNLDTETKEAVTESSEVCEPHSLSPAQLFTTSSTESVAQPVVGHETVTVKASSKTTVRVPQPA